MVTAAKALSLRPSEGSDGKDDGEHPPLTANLVAELGTARADPNVAAQEAAAQLSGTCGGELLADVCARDLPGLAVFDQGRAGPKHERLHLLGLALEHLGDLAVVEVAEL